MAPVQLSEWEPTIQQLKNTVGTILVLGSSGCGKVSFTSSLCAAAFDSGKTVSIIDADPASTGVGPICCIATGRVDSAIRSLGQIKPDEISFIGSVSALANPVTYVAQLQKMMQVCRTSGSELTIIFTSDQLRGASAVNMNQALIDVIRPNVIVTLQRKTESERITSLYQGRSDIEIVPVPVPKLLDFGGKSLVAERQFIHFNQLFDGATLFEFPIEKLRMAGTWIGQSDPVPPHILKFISNSLGTTVYYGELDNGHLGVVTGNAVARETGISIIQEQLRNREITLTPAKLLKNLVVGLSDQHDHFLAVGKMESIDFRSRIFKIKANLRTAGAIQIVRFGSIRVDNAGKITGSNSIGDV